MSQTDLSAAAARLRMPLDELRALVSESQQDWVVLSGKMASGKDTVAAELSSRMYSGEAVVMRYGDLMRLELSRALSAWQGRLDGSDEEVTALVAGVLGLTLEQAEVVVRELGPEMRASRGALDAWDRSNGLRVVLQALGGPWRTALDEDYWARQACRAALTARRDRPVLLTGGRFAPDVEIPRLLGAVVIRIDVSLEVQLQRLSARDGLSPDPETLRHPGEVVLDDWDGFTSRVDGDKDLPVVVDQVAAVVASSRRRSARVPGHAGPEAPGV